ncbi:hypothetical protein [Persicobacter diffluens]|uniref:Serine protease n=1 Tax=Persicobacter diffluens TaxID=981 RepID=A0AAN4W4W0_9BACT|nr:hypothetical protein PEDI_54310 [Persicobacter diffluens]
MKELKSRVDQLIGGIQIQSKRKRGIGTLGCIVFDRLSGKPLGLTNKHILKKRRGFSVIQPARKKRASEYIIGNIFRKGKNGKENDFAVFEINTNNRAINQKNSLFGLAGKITEFVEPEIGMLVQKVGQSTGHTYGIIQKVSSKTIIIKGNPDKPCEEISIGGDSGSLWVTDEENFKAVALHRAGEKNNTTTPIEDTAYAIPISRVLKELKIRF